MRISVKPNGFALLETSLILTILFPLVIGIFLMSNEMATSWRAKTLIRMGVSSILSELSNDQNTVLHDNKALTNLSEDLKILFGDKFLLYVAEYDAGDGAIVDSAYIGNYAVSAAFSGCKNSAIREISRICERMPSLFPESYLAHSCVGVRFLFVYSLLPSSISGYFKDQVDCDFVPI